MIALSVTGRELIVLGAAFLLAALFARAGRRIGLPTIPLFMLAGVLAGPNTPGPVLFDRPEDLQLLATLGLVFLLFYLGVEFSVEDLTGGGARLLGSAALYLALNIGAGIAFGFALGWGTEAAFVVAGATGISSSAIVTKLLVELGRLSNPETKLILGIIVIEDLFLALYLAALAPVLGGADSVAQAVTLFLGAVAFLVGLGLVARYGSRVVDRLVGPIDDELLIVTFVGFTLLLAGLAFVLGASDAIGAFMAGLVFSGTLAAERIRRLVLPLRDAFAAIFFFAFGLSIDPAAVATVAAPAAAAIAMSTVLALVAGVAAARINGLGRQSATAIAFALLSRGEFALILAALAASAGVDERLGPFVAVYVFVLAIVSPVLASRSVPLARIVPRRLLEDPGAAAATRRRRGARSRRRGR